MRAEACIDRDLHGALRAVATVAVSCQGEHRADEDLISVRPASLPVPDADTRMNVIGFIASLPREAHRLYAGDGYHLAIG